MWFTNSQRLLSQPAFPVRVVLPLLLLRLRLGGRGRVARVLLLVEVLGLVPGAGALRRVVVVLVPFGVLVLGPLVHFHLVADDHYCVECGLRLVEHGAFVGGLVCCLVLPVVPGSETKGEGGGRGCRIA